MATAAIPQQVIIDTIGPLFIGIILNWMFFGCLILQIYSYSQRCQYDNWFIKGLVIFVFMCDVAQTGATCDYAWKEMVSGWGDSTIFTSSPKSSIVLVIINPIIASTVQIFFAWRIWRLVDKKYKFLYTIPVLIVLVAIMQSVAPFLIASVFINNTDLQEIIADPAIHTEGIIWLSSSFTADALIAFAMLFILQNAKKRAMSSKTETMLTRLIVNSVNTGFITAVVACVELATLVKYPTTNYHQTPAFVLGKLYSNVLLANLNARQNLRTGGSRAEDSSGNVHTFSSSGRNFKGPQAYKLNTMASQNADIETGTVHVRTEVLRDTDYDQSNYLNPKKVNPDF